MKKSFVILFTALVLSLSLIGCGSSKAEIALITDVGTIEDGSYNQGAWEGIVRYGDENEIGYKYFKPKEAYVDSYLDSIYDAVQAGAKIIVCPGYLPEEAVYVAQSKYPKVHFILLDGVVHNQDYSDYTVKDNVMQIAFAEEQAGFLAGYAAVRDGYNRLGFMGGVSEPAVIRFGYGFVQGADYAAIEMGKQIEIKYCYSDTFYEDENVYNRSSEWYSSGTEVIFACGGAMGRSVMKAAEDTGHKVIGVDVDQSSESDTVITSSLKMLSNAVYSGLFNYYNDSFKGGCTTTLTAAEDGVGLSMASSKFNIFNNDDYEKIYSQLADGTLVPCAQTQIGTTEDLMIVNTTIDYQTLNTP